MNRITATDDDVTMSDAKPSAPSANMNKGIMFNAVRSGGGQGTFSQLPAQQQQQQQQRLPSSPIVLNEEDYARQGRFAMKQEQPQWHPSTALTGLGNIDFGAERTHFGDGFQNYGAQIYDVGASMNHLFSTKDIPDSWLHQGSASQFNLLNQEEFKYALSVMQQLTLNPPFHPPPVISQIVPDLTTSQTSDGDVDMNQTVSQKRTDNPVATQQKTGGRGEFNIGKAAEGVFAAKKGVDFASKFWNVASSAEESELLGESVVEGTTAALEGTLGGVMEAVGAEGALGAGVAAVAEAVGGAAVVGATVAAAEVVAGVAVVGLGIYETYKAFGGEQDFSGVTKDLSSGLQAAVQWGEKLTHWIP